MLIASAIVTDLAKKYEAMDSFAAAAVSKNKINKKHEKVLRNKL